VEPDGPPRTAAVADLVDLVNLGHRVTAHSAVLVRVMGISKRPTLTSAPARIDHLAAATR
jgi:hypothetical protein